MGLMNKKVILLFFSFFFGLELKFLKVTSVGTATVSTTSPEKIKQTMYKNSTTECRTLGFNLQILKKGSGKYKSHSRNSLKINGEYV